MLKNLLISLGLSLLFILITLSQVSIFGHADIIESDEATVSETQAEEVQSDLHENNDNNGNHNEGNQGNGVGNNCVGNQGNDMAVGCAAGAQNNEAIEPEPEPEQELEVVITEEPEQEPEPEQEQEEPVTYSHHETNYSSTYLSQLYPEEEVQTEPEPELVIEPIEEPIESKVTHAKRERPVVSAKAMRPEPVVELSSEEEECTTAPFRDISGHQYEEAIIGLYCAGAIHGYKDQLTNFGPDNQILTSHFVKMAVLWFDLTQNQHELGMDPNKYLEVMIDLGLMDPTTNVNDYLSTEEITRILNLLINHSIDVPSNLRGEVSNILWTN